SGQNKQSEFPRTHHDPSRAPLLLLFTHSSRPTLHCSTASRRLHRLHRPTLHCPTASRRLHLPTLHCPTASRRLHRLHRPTLHCTTASRRLHLPTLHCPTASRRLHLPTLHCPTASRRLHRPTLHCPTASLRLHTPTTSRWAGRDPADTPPSSSLRSPQCSHCSPVPSGVVSVRSINQSIDRLID
uniref:Uncharacterized protein n=1 Tax=Salarias fasciatus TaxID=181472 RepID=A0A672H9H8_SALFA